MGKHNGQDSKGKSAKRLAARIASWESMKPSKSGFHKPGSLKK